MGSRSPDESLCRIKASLVDTKTSAEASSKQRLDCHLNRHIFSLLLKQTSSQFQSCLIVMTHHQRVINCYSTSSSSSCIPFILHLHEYTQPDMIIILIARRRYMKCAFTVLFLLILIVLSFAAAAADCFSWRINNHHLVSMMSWSIIRLVESRDRSPFPRPEERIMISIHLASSIHPPPPSHHDYTQFRDNLQLI